MGTDKRFPLSGNKVLQGLAELRTQELLCDVRLEAEGATFPAHKAVLAAASPYFHAMFTGGFKEASEATISMKEASSEGLRRILNAVYSSELSISDESLEDVLSLANQFQMKECLEAGEKFLCDPITGIDCLRYLALAEKYELSKVMDKCEEFILENFEVISKTEGFKELCMDKVCQYMSNDKLRLPNGEIEVYRTAMRWLEHNVETVNSKDNVSSVEPKYGSCFEILQFVRFPCIPSDLLIDEVLDNPIINRNEPCKQLVKEALRFHSNTFAQPLMDGPQFRPRGEEKLVLMKEGTHKPSGNPTLNRNYFKMLVMDLPWDAQSTKNYFEIETRVSLEKDTMSVVSAGNYLFIFGSQREPLRPVALRYDITEHKWLSLQPFPSDSKTDVAICRRDGDIFFTGGKIQNFPTLTLRSPVTADFHRYSIRDNSWTRKRVPTCTYVCTWCCIL